MSHNFKKIEFLVFGSYFRNTKKLSSEKFTKPKKRYDKRIYPNKKNNNEITHEDISKVKIKQMNLLQEIDEKESLPNSKQNYIPQDKQSSLTLHNNNALFQAPIKQHLLIQTEELNVSEITFLNNLNDYSLSKEDFENFPQITLERFFKVLR